MEAVYTDPETGLRLDRATWRLIVTFLGTSLLILGGGAIASLLIGVTRETANELR